MMTAGELEASTDSFLLLYLLVPGDSQLQGQRAKGIKDHPVSPLFYSELFS